VERVRAVQQARGYYNARLPVRLIRPQCALDRSRTRTLEMAMRRMSLSARAHDRILKVARTIADLDESNRFRQNTWRKPCMQYRSLDRNYWS
jgi:magnesium chelatase family protein